jgi:hypothetical protein
MFYFYEIHIYFSNSNNIPLNPTSFAGEESVNLSRSCVPQCQPTQRFIFLFCNDIFELVMHQVKTNLNY